MARETIWRILHGKNDANEWTLRRIAEATGRAVPGIRSANESNSTPPTLPGGPGRQGEPGWTDDSVEPTGWLFADAAEAEGQFGTFLRHIERTTRAMVGNPVLFSAEENRINQLAVCRAALRSAELAGRPVPAWLTRIYNEVIGGSFR
ncbi:MAG: hypothetical protein ABI637_09355 [Gemmatimonadota bacterium]